ncbi:MAG: hypothetical protein KDB22_17970 [Planctomycetales bacterium]|nr:hypothetical protein [Planctomycetales bacterium]
MESSGGGLIEQGNNLRLSNTIVVGNLRNTGTELVNDDIHRYSLVFGENNVVGIGGSPAIVDGIAGNRIGVDPFSVVEIPLRNNGGPTPTHQLLGGAAVDAGISTSLAAGVDQRGQSRPFNTALPNAPGSDGTDVGAVESQISQVYSLGDVVWHDVNGNGVQDSGEPGLDGVTVHLLDAGGTLISQTTTSHGGLYRFELLAGSYQVQILPLPGFDFTVANALGISEELDSDVNTATGRTATFLLDSDSGQVADAGLVFDEALGSISDLVWNDLNSNGIQDGGEPGVAGVTLHLLDGAGARLRSTTSDAGGHFAFFGLTPASYQIDLELPYGYLHTANDVGVNEYTDSDVDLTTGKTSLIAIGSGEHDFSVDAGIFARGDRAIIGNWVWDDLNANGVQDSGEPGMNGVKVNLYRDNFASLELLASTVTVDGRYAFYGLESSYPDCGDPPAPGCDPDLILNRYVLEIEPPFGFELSSQDIGGSDELDSDFDSVGQTEVLIRGLPTQLNFDAGLVFDASTTVSNLVWDDRDGDGIQDPGEPGIDGVRVNLFDAGIDTVDSGPYPLIAQTITTDGGRYFFGGLDEGNYVVQALAPAGYAFTLPAQGLNPELDSNANELTGRAFVALSTGDHNHSIDFGVVRSIGSTLTGKTWWDVNFDGLSTAERGYSDARVRLLDAAGAIELASSIVDAEGNYQFNGIAAGIHQVEFLLPRRFSITSADVGDDDTIDSDVNLVTRRATIDVPSDAVINFVDAGMLGSLTGGTIVGRVWDDQTGDHIRNDAFEPGVADVWVTLLDSSGTVVLESIRTDAWGYFRFPSLLDGDYMLQFERPFGFSFAEQNVGSDRSSDSDPDPDTGLVHISLSGFPFVSDISAGLQYDLTHASVLGRTWNDLLANGLQESGEPGLSDIPITLLDSTGTRVIRTTQSDEFGAYVLRGIESGAYRFDFGTRAGYRHTLSNQGTDDARDSDADTTLGQLDVTFTAGESNTITDAGYYYSSVLHSVGNQIWLDSNADGIHNAGEPGVSDVVIDLFDGDGGHVAVVTSDAGGYYSFSGIASGDYRVRVTPPAGLIFTAPDVGGDDHRDSDILYYGYSPLFSLADDSLSTSLDAGLKHGFASASITGSVWQDSDGDGTSYREVCERRGFPPRRRCSSSQESAIVGRPVLLFDATRRLMARATTNTRGYYEFTGLSSGTYHIQIPTLRGTGFTTPNVGADTRDSDFSTSGWATVVIHSGSYRLDAGVLYIGAPPGASMQISGRAWYDLDRDGIQDPAEGGLADVDLRINGMRVRTDIDGNYRVTGLPIATHFVDVDTPGGFHLSPANVGSDTRDSDIHPSGTTSVTVGVDTVVDIGFYRNTASIGDRVWEDRNGDGIQDPSEPGLPDVNILLWDATGANLLASTTSDAFGHYSFGFSDIPGDYVLEFIRPSGFEFTNNLGGDDSTNSDVDPVTGRVHVSLAVGETEISIDAGFVRLFAPDLGVVSNRIWLDEDADGIQDATEPGIDNVLVELYDANQSTFLAYTVSESGGWYAFDALSAGDYKLRFLPLPGYDFASQDSGTDDRLDSDVDTANGEVTLSLGVGERIDHLDAGYKLTAPSTHSIGDFVWNDSNANGIQDTTETGLADVVVTLFDAESGQPVAETSSDVAGHFEFDYLVTDGTYYLQFLAPLGFIASPRDIGLDDELDSDIDPENGFTSIVNVNGVVSGLDAGFSEVSSTEIASIGGVAWDDQNGDGIQDPHEPGLEGIVIRLTDESGALVLNSVRTSDAGQYRFPALSPGEYFVDAIAPLGRALSPVGQAAGGFDSNVNATTGRTQRITINAGEALLEIDVGLLTIFPNHVVASSRFVGVLPMADPDGSGPQTQMGRDAFVSISDAVLGLDSLAQGVPLHLLSETYDAFTYDRTGGTLHLITPNAPATIAQASINEGALLLDGEFAFPGGIQVYDGGTLAGVGTINGDVTVNGGLLAPGFSPGILHTGSLVLGAGATYSVELNGDIPGATGYDQTIVTGTVDVSGSQLAVSLGYTPMVGAQFLILENDSDDAILGTFAALSEGDAIYLGSNLEAVISYVGGSGNDVVLTVRIADEQPPAVIGFTRHSPEAQITNADLVRFYAEFSEPVTQIDSGDFTVAGTSTASVTSITPVSGTGETVFLVTVSGGDLADFNGDVGINLAPAQDIADAFGNALPSGEPTTDQTYVLDNIAPTINQFVIDDGSAQRSMLRSLTYEFDTPVAYSFGAFVLQTSTGQSISFSIDISSGVLTNQLVFTFPGLLGGSVADGNYALLIDENLIADAAGNSLDGNNNGVAGGARDVDEFFRFFGDYDGDRDVDATDYLNFRRTYRRDNSSSLFNSAFDVDANEIIDGSDYIEFRRRYRRSLLPP